MGYCIGKVDEIQELVSTRVSGSPCSFFHSYIIPHDFKDPARKFRRFRKSSGNMWGKTYGVIRLRRLQECYPVDGQLHGKGIRDTSIAIRMFLPSC
jgi:hypothetical protein